MSLTLGDYIQLTPAEELKDSPTGSGDREDAERIRRYRVAWDDADDFLAERMGGVRVVQGTPVHFQPAPYTPHSVLIAKSYDFRGEKLLGTDANGDNRYENAIITLHYRPPDPDEDESATDDEQAWGEESAQYHVQMVEVPAYGTQWASGTYSGEALDHPIARPVVFGNLTFRRSFIADLDRSALAGHIGKLNATEFLGYPAKTLMLAGFSVRHAFNHAGQTIRRSADLAIKFRSIVWDKFPDRDGKWETVQKSDGSDLFDTVEFADL